MNRNRALAVLAAGLAISIVAHVANAAGAEASKPAASQKAAASREIDRGRYMVLTGHCNNCHTAGYIMKEGNVPEQQWLLGNPVGHRGPWGTTYASNLRLTVQNFTEEQWVRYAKALKARPTMPWWSFSTTTEQDLRAMYKFIKRLGPAGEPAKPFLPPGKEPSPPYEVRQLVQ